MPLEPAQWPMSFFVAFRVPNLLRRLFAEGSLTMAFVPIFKNLQLKQGKESAFCFARSTFYWLITILTIITIIAIIFAPYITSIVAPGFKTRPDIFNFTTKLIRICFPYIIFISGVALCMGILNSLGHFAMPALAPCMLNIVLIGCAFFAYFKKNKCLSCTLIWCLNCRNFTISHAATSLKEL